MLSLPTAAAFGAVATLAIASTTLLLLSRRSNKARLAQIVKAFGLIPHPEGGYFVETFRSGSTPMMSKGKTDEGGDLMVASKPGGEGREGGKRNVLTSIYYCLTRDSPRQWWANNMSDHIHYWHGGGSLTYHILHPDGRYERAVLGPRAERGEKMQLIVRGGSFKCAHLAPGAGEFVLLGEAVAPGFDFRDFAFALTSSALFNELKSFLKVQPETDFDNYYDEREERKA